jgi:formylglycine-generating enzyme required for sulfatase activity
VYAIVESGGRQYRAEEGHSFSVENMLGNVTEWCQEPYRTEYLAPPGDEILSADGRQRSMRFAEGAWRTYRGGSFMSSPRELRSASRQRTSFSSHPFSGFRVARTMKD